LASTRPLIPSPEATKNNGNNSEAIKKGPIIGANSASSSSHFWTARLVTPTAFAAAMIVQSWENSSKNLSRRCSFPAVAVDFRELLGLAFEEDFRLFGPVF
jgi:hypothetical protein